jgi:hypothetical protein
MTNRPGKFDGERRQTAGLAPENANDEQQDEDTQAQSVTDDALNRATSVFGLEDSDKADGGIDDDPTPDLVDRMKQMDSSGAIDMTAYEGEPNHDDNVDKYGKRNRPDDLPGDGAE